MENQQIEYLLPDSDEAKKLIWRDGGFATVDADDLNPSLERYNLKWRGSATHPILISDEVVSLYRLVSKNVKETSAMQTGFSHLLIYNIIPMRLAANYPEVVKIEENPEDDWENNLFDRMAYLPSYHRNLWEGEEIHIPIHEFATWLFHKLFPDN